MATTQSEIAKLDKELTNLIKKDIKDKDLVDSGKMYNSIDVKTTYSNGKLSLSIEAEDYFEYVSEEYNIMKDVLASPQWTKAIEDAMFGIINNTIDENLNT